MGLLLTKYGGASPGTPEHKTRPIGILMGLQHDKRIEKLPTFAEKGKHHQIPLR